MTMTSKWTYTYHEGSDDPMDETPDPWWEVVNTGAPFPNYFVVENVGDPTDGERLASLLNEREQLLIDKIDMQAALAEARAKLWAVGGTGYEDLICLIDELVAR